MEVSWKRSSHLALARGTRSGHEKLKAKHEEQKMSRSDHVNIGAIQVYGLLERVDTSYPMVIEKSTEGREGYCPY